MNSYYNQTLLNVEAILARTLPSEHLGEWAELNAGCDVSSVSEDSLLKINTPALDLLERGGKRWRPVLMCLSCELYGGGKRALPLTPLVEFPHNGSLIIDDIEDNSDMRRGKPAVHLTYGTDMAINTGNWIYFQPLVLLEIHDLDPELTLRLYRFYGQALRRLHLGQGLDIGWHKDPEFYPGQEEYLQMCRFKTGSLARLAGQAGAALAGAGEEESDFFGGMMEKMGIAFQILDDVKNLTTGNPGKNRGDDIVEGKKSLPVILFADGNPGKTGELSELFRSAGEKGFSAGGREVEAAISLMEEAGTIAQAREEAVAMLSEVREELVKKFEPSRSLSAVLEMVDSFLT